jgi:hypothetical protein
MKFCSTFVLMLIHGTPLTLDTPTDADVTSRFWNWQGTSGQKYIHSVYELDACPPLPGAIYVAVKRAGHLRIALAVGRFAPFWDKTLGDDEFATLESLGADEVHVHLLARSPEMAEDIKFDLASALDTAPPHYGFSESAPSWVHAA